MKTTPITRREFGQRLGVLGVAGLTGLPAVLRAGTAPAIVRGVNGRPGNVGGVMSGDVRADAAVIWSRSDRPATMLVEYATTESFKNSSHIRGPVVLEDTEFAGKLEIPCAAPGQQMFYRIRFEDIADPRIVSEPVMGRFRTISPAGRDVFFAWSADTCGQGFGIDVTRGGMQIYETMRRLQPDFFVHAGDTMYADGPIPAEVPLEDGSVWRNVVTEAKSKVAETLSEFRGNHFYNLLDEHVRRFNAEVPVYFQWDDHEVVNNWSFSKSLEKDERYTEKNVFLLAARSRRAFFECLPIRPHPQERIFRNMPYGPLLELFILDMRSHRGPNSPNRQSEPGPDTAILGSNQLAELKGALAASRSTWKVICSDMPISLMVTDGRENYEAVANGDGPVLGREHEIAELLSFIRDRKINNIIWITGDVHHCASYHYDPKRAAFKEFEPFWEFVSGPLHAGTFPSPRLDNTFGPERRFLGIPEDLSKMESPLAGHQFFGTVHIDAATGELTVTHLNVAGEKLWSVTLAAEGFVSVG